MCTAGRGRHERVLWDGTEKHKHSHKGLCGVDISDDYNNSKFKIEVHHENISKQVSIN